MNGLDLFSGIAGISIALEPWVRTVAYCELDQYARSVLLSRMASGEIHNAPIWDNIRTLCAEHIPVPVDIIFGGFPCQDISVAGAGAGLEGERSGLVFEVLRLISECRPKFVYLENVPALAVRGLDRLLLELDALGYDARWTIVSAAEMGAPHLRERIWIAAHRDDLRELQQGGSLCIKRGWDSDGTKEVANIAGIGSEPRRGGGDESQTGTENTFSSAGRTSDEGGWADSGHWKLEPSMGGLVHGFPFGVDRVRCLGNAVVPQAAREAFQRLIGIGD